MPFASVNKLLFVPFFPRSVGLAPVPAPPNGAFVIAPSIACHLHSNPFIKSYSIRPAIHILSKKPDLAIPEIDHGPCLKLHKIVAPISIGNQ
jgi:hypothetical protein